MKKTAWILFALVLISTPLMAQKKSKGFTQKQHQKALQLQYKSIVKMANASFCGHPNDFAFVPFGTNPCGGAKEYLIYAKDIDRAAFFRNVEQYNQAEAVYNEKYQIKGTCTVLEVPTNIKCVNKKAELVY